MCNDLHYVAHEMGAQIKSLAVDVSVTFAGEPLLATAAEVLVSIEMADAPMQTDELLRRAIATSTVSNSLARGVAVNIGAR